MPVSLDGEYETVSAVLMRPQAEQIRALQRIRRRRRHSGVSFSEVLREVVEAGLEALLCAPDTGVDTMTESGNGRQDGQAA